jgi:hypothetical protein
VNRIPTQDLDQLVLVHHGPYPQQFRWAHHLEPRDMLVMFYNVVFTKAIFLFKRLHMVVLIGLLNSLGGL